MKTNSALLDTHLQNLQLPFRKEHYRPFAAKAAKDSLTHLDYFTQLIEGEAAARSDRAVQRRLKAARFPVIKTLDSFRWDWPKKINRLEVQDLFRLQFIPDHGNVIFLGLVGRQDPPRHRPRLRRLPARPQRPLHHRHRRHQLPPLRPA